MNIVYLILQIIIVAVLFSNIDILLNNVSKEVNLISVLFLLQASFNVNYYLNKIFILYEKNRIGMMNNINNINNINNTNINNNDSDDINNNFIINVIETNLNLINFTLFIVMIGLIILMKKSKSKSNGNFIAICSLYSLMILGFGQRIIQIINKKIRSRNIIINTDHV